MSPQQKKTFWYILQVQSGSEKRTTERILEKAKVLSSGNLISQIFNPTEKTIQDDHNSKIDIQRSSYAGYLFIEAQVYPLPNEILFLIKGIDNRAKILGSSPIPTSQIEKIKQLNSEQSTRLKNSISFEIGELVNIKKGNEGFNDFKGSIEEIDIDKRRLKVSVSVFGRSTLVHLDFNQVEKI